MPLPLVTVTAQFFDAAGQPAEGQVDFTLTWPMRDTVGDAIYERVTTHAPIDAAGDMSVQLVPTDHPDVEPPGVQYEVVQRIHGAPAYTWRFGLATLPSPVDLADIDPATPTTAALDAVPVFVQPAEPPAAVRKGLWVQTGVGPGGDGFRFRVKEGA